MLSVLAEKRKRANKLTEKNEVEEKKNKYTASK